jgi:hypothetical protein
MRSSDDMRRASLNWRRSSLCQTGECVEIAAYDGGVIMRSSAHPDIGYAYFDSDEFSSLIAAIKAGEFGPAL